MAPAPLTAEILALKCGDHKSHDPYIWRTCQFAVALRSQPELQTFGTNTDHGLGLLGKF